MVAHQGIRVLQDNATLPSATNRDPSFSVRPPRVELRTLGLQLLRGELADLLHRRWMYQLARQGRWQTLVDNYRITNDTKLNCYYTTALYRVGATQQAHTEMTGLWLTGRSLPASCDPAIDAWRDAGRMTDALIWERIQLAIRAGHGQA
ncbi:MAG: hypothetical protein P8Y25_08025, partial [Chromatiaceae bacterium]